MRSIVALFAATMLLLSCSQKNIPTTTISAELLEAPDALTEDFETIYTDSGVVRYRLKAPVMANYDRPKNKYTEFSEGFRIEQYNQDGSISSTLQAEYGKSLTEEDLLEARINVVAVNDIGDSLLTDLLFYDQKKKIIYSDEFVRIIKDGNVFTGIGFESDELMKNWKIFKPKGDLKIKVANE